MSASNTESTPVDSSVIKALIDGDEKLAAQMLSLLKRMAGTEKFVKRITTDCGDCYDICIEETDTAEPKLTLKKVDSHHHHHHQRHYGHHHQAQYYPQPAACPPNPWMNAGLMGTWLGMNNWFAAPNCMPMSHCGCPHCSGSRY